MGSQLQRCIDLEQEHPLTFLVSPFDGSCFPFSRSICLIYNTQLIQVKTLIIHFLFLTGHMY